MVQPLLDVMPLGRLLQLLQLCTVPHSELELNLVIGVHDRNRCESPRACGRLLLRLHLQQLPLRLKKKQSLTYCSKQ